MNMDVLQEELKKRNLTLDHIMEYIKFEDECIKKGFTFNSLIEAREKQIPKKPLSYYIGDSYGIHKCLICGCHVDDACNFCPQCGNALAWEQFYFFIYKYRKVL